MTGVPASPSGYPAEPEPVPVSALRAGIPNALDIAAARAFSERWIRARQMTSEGPELVRPRPILQYHPEANDNRRKASGRDPCRRCNIRGDIGCVHQAPCDAAERPTDRVDVTGKRIVPRHNSRWA